MKKVSEKKEITIYEIAKEAGVSPSTVSRVLTNSANVRKQKREKVESLIEKYNFRPNALAKGLSDASSKTIGIIVADIRNPYYADIYMECEAAAKEAGYMVLLCNSLGSTELEIKQLEVLQQQKVSAIIQVGGGVDDSVPDEAYVRKVNQVAESIPMVCAGRLPLVAENCYGVEIDSSKASELLIEHLISLGHEKIALIGGRMNVVSTFEKYQMYRSLLEKHEIEFHEEYVVEGGYNYYVGYDGMNQLFEKQCIPTAVVAINDFSAAGVMRSIREHKYRIPEEISVVSYDNTLFSDLLIPKITSIAYENHGKKLVETALQLIEEQEVPQMQKVTPCLVLKESSVQVWSEKTEKNEAN